MNMSHQDSQELLSVLEVLHLFRALSLATGHYYLRLLYSLLVIGTIVGL